MARKAPALFASADMTGLAQMNGAISEGMKQLSTPAHIRTVIQTTHSVFAKMFDEHMKVWVQGNREGFHHVYEYAPGGDPYRWIGNNSYKLWKHRITFRQSDHAQFTWEWKAAKRPNPTYQQRRDSTVGWDGIRTISEQEFLKLNEKGGKVRHTFFWKAPMLEYGITRTVLPRNPETRLAIPSGGKLNFTFVAFVTTQAPGRTKGNFTEAWTTFWATQTEDKWDQVLGKQITEDAARRLTNAIDQGAPKPRSRMRTFKASAMGGGSESAAFEQGRRLAMGAMKAHTNSMRAIERAAREVDVG